MNKKKTVDDYVATKPFKAIANPGATRGHKEQRLGSGIVCQVCKGRKPKRGNWAKACSDDRRVFIGGAD